MSLPSRDSPASNFINVAFSILCLKIPFNYSYYKWLALFLPSWPSPVPSHFNHSFLGFRCPWHHWDCSCSCWPGGGSRDSFVWSFLWYVSLPKSVPEVGRRVSVEYMISYFCMLKDLNGISERWVLQATHYVNMQLRKSSVSLCWMQFTLHSTFCPAATIVTTRSIMW